MVDDNSVCYRHPHTFAATACHRCDRPICVDCMKQASVGFHCPECVAGAGQQVITPRDMAKMPQLTAALIAVNVVAFLAQYLTNDRITSDGLLFGPAVDAGEWWRLLTGGFLHANLLHIAFNMYLLNMLGRELERALGMFQFGLIYFGGLFGGSLAVVAFNWDVATLGASGAVLGLGGALGAVMWGLGRDPRQSPVFGLIVLNLALPLLIGGISFWGHLGGVVFGAITASVVFTLPHRKIVSQQTANALGVGVVVAFAVASYVMSLAGGL